MTTSSSWPDSHRKRPWRDGFFAPALYASIALAIFVVVTQLLTTTGAISLSTTQLLATWLVAAALIVLLWIAYMICRAYVTEETPAELQGNVEPPREPIAEDLVVRSAPPTRVEETMNDPEEGAMDGSPPHNGNAAEDEDAWVPPRELRHLVGTPRPVSMAEVFPDGCYLQPDSIRLDVTDKLTGQQMHQCRVLDRNPAKDQTPETVVNIPADRPPVLPTGQRFGWVEFDNLTIIPYITDRTPMRIRYSLRATGIHAAVAPAGRPKAVWTASSNGQAVDGDQTPGLSAVPQ